RRRLYRSFGGVSNLQTKRGCPLRCAYCVYNRVEGSAYRFRAPEAVRAEIEEMAAHGVVDAEFTDSTFNVPLHHAKAVLAEIARARPRVRLHTAGMNPREGDPELFDLMKRAGFATVMISAEAASDAALEGLGKGYGVREVGRMVDLVSASGFEAFWYFLFGGPGETDATVDETFRFLDARIPKRHLVYLGAGIRIQKGAPVEETARREGALAAGESLLEPKFYFSPRLSRDRLFARIREEVLAHPNYLQVVDFQSTDAPLRLARLLKLFRVRRPAWSFVPWINRFFDRLGRKRR
ncbi:MAG: radical SAM protein, partial [Planctomycetes bacterium]|nr:radical SAM protein [Planctomycetota bacterium]